LVCFDPKTGESRHFLHHPLDTHSLSNDAVLTVFVDQQGQVWAGGGVFAYSKASNCFLDRYAPVADVFRHYELPPTFRNAAIFAITEDNKGRIWFALDNAGLGCLDPSSGRVNLFNSSNKKLPLDNFHGLQADQKGRLWFSTSQAVGYFNPQTDSYRLFELDEKEEMPHFMSKSTQSEKGAFFWTSLRGFYHFDTGKMDQNSQDKVPDILLTDFLIYHQPQLAGGNSPMQEPVWSTDKIHARYSDELFTFHFASLDFRYPESNQYQYKLDPYDPYWRQTETEQSATYIHVPPGQYTFRVRTANREGFWSPEKRVQIFISSPWWQRWWAYALLAFSIGGLIISIYRIRLRRALDQAEAYRLKELDTIKSRLYTNITHEFRTPLMIILGMAREILDHPDKHFRGGLKMIMQNGRKLLHLVNQLLDLSKLDQGRMKLRLQQGDIISYLRYLVDSYQTYAKSKKVQLHFLPQKEKLLMDFDPEKLQKIVGNLIANALKFTPENGHIYLFVDQGMRKEGEYLQIKVKDTGPGIRPEALPFIFDRFYQGDFEKNQVQETSQPGTGIGLALVRELVALMGGEVRVESQYGNGAEFIIGLPVAQNSKDQVSMEDKTIAPLPNDTETNSAGESHSKGGAPLILIVEDNPDVINLLTIILSPLYSLKIARNGKEGLEQSIEKTPDLILADIRMPVMNGLDLCLRLKNDERTSHIPIIILTARGDISGKLSALEMGADAYLVKPFHREELLIRVKMLLELRKKLQRHFLDVSGLGEKNTFTEEPEKFAEAENRFVRKIIQIVEDHLDDFDFSVDRLCREATLSNSQLNRKLVALTGLSASRFIRHIRLSKAKDLLLEKDASVTTVAFDTGFQDPSYFGRVFKKAFGVTPLEWRENNIGQEIKP
jgi:signal transduction histidine kinase/DNA-binding response OmpR family regulator